MLKYSDKRLDKSSGVMIKFPWKPVKCSECRVFEHDESHCLNGRKCVQSPVKEQDVWVV